MATKYVYKVDVRDPDEMEEMDELYFLAKDSDEAKRKAMRYLKQGARDSGIDEEDAEQLILSAERQRKPTQPMGAIPLEVLQKAYQREYQRALKNEQVI